MVFSRHLYLIRQLSSRELRTLLEGPAVEALGFELTSDCSVIQRLNRCVTTRHRACNLKTHDGSLRWKLFVPVLMSQQQSFFLFFFFFENSSCVLVLLASLAHCCRSPNWSRVFSLIDSAEPNQEPSPSPPGREEIEPINSGLWTRRVGVRDWHCRLTAVSRRLFEAPLIYAAPSLCSDRDGVAGSGKEPWALLISRPGLAPVHIHMSLVQSVWNKRRRSRRRNELL